MEIRDYFFISAVVMNDHSLYIDSLIGLVGCFHFFSVSNNAVVKVFCYLAVLGIELKAWCILDTCCTINCALQYYFM